MDIRHDPQEVIKALESILARDSGHVEVMLRLAAVYQAVGMPAQSAELTERARVLAPDHACFRRKTTRSPASPSPEGVGGQVKALFQRLLDRG